MPKLIPFVAQFMEMRRQYSIRMYVLLMANNDAPLIILAVRPGAHFAASVVSPLLRHGSLLIAPFQLSPSVNLSICLSLLPL